MNGPKGGDFYRAARACKDTTPPFKMLQTPPAIQQGASTMFIETEDGALINADDIGSARQIKADGTRQWITTDRRAASAEKKSDLEGRGRSKRASRMVNCCPVWLQVINDSSKDDKDRKRGMEEKEI